QTTFQIALDAQAIFLRRRHQPRRPPLGQLAIAVSKAKRAGPWSSQHACKLVVDYWEEGGSDDDLTSAARQGEKTTARGHQARKPRADDRPRHRHRTRVKARVLEHTADALRRQRETARRIAETGEVEDATPADVER